jgi:NMD protein affecting ribosome stability and mRNA decay
MPINKRVLTEVISKRLEDKGINFYILSKGDKDKLVRKELRQLRFKDN